MSGESTACSHLDFSHAGLGMGNVSHKAMCWWHCRAYLQEVCCWGCRPPCLLSRVSMFRLPCSHQVAACCCLTIPTMMGCVPTILLLWHCFCDIWAMKITDINCKEGRNVFWPMLLKRMPGPWLCPLFLSIFWPSPSDNCCFTKFSMCVWCAWTTQVYHDVLTVLAHL